jgi:hypothetical protein
MTLLPLRWGWRRPPPCPPGRSRRPPPAWAPCAPEAPCARIPLRSLRLATWRSRLSQARSTSPSASNSVANPARLTPSACAVALSCRRRDAEMQRVSVVSTGVGTGSRGSWRSSDTGGTGGVASAGIIRGGAPRRAARGDGVAPRAALTPRCLPCCVWSGSAPAGVFILAIRDSPIGRRFTGVELSSSRGMMSLSEQHCNPGLRDGCPACPTRHMSDVSLRACTRVQHIVLEVRIER